MNYASRSYAIVIVKIYSVLLGKYQEYESRAYLELF